MKVKTLIERLKEYAEWADANEWEVPLCLGDDLRKAAAYIEQKELVDDGGNYIIDLAD